jgi:hypothetical protein
MCFATFDVVNGKRLMERMHFYPPLGVEVISEFEEFKE